jgi:hypothetical protein
MSGDEPQEFRRADGPLRDSQRQVGTNCPNMCYTHSKYSELVTVGFIPSRPPLSKANKADFEP